MYTRPSPILTAAEAAAMIEPYLHGLGAVDWLADARRRKRRYRADPVEPPRPTKAPGSRRVFYRRADIERVIADLRDPAPKLSAPVTTPPTPAATASATPAPFVILGGGDRVRIVLDGKVIKIAPTDARRLAADLAFAADRAEAA